MSYVAICGGLKITHERLICSMSFASSLLPQFQRLAALHCLMLIVSACRIIMYEGDSCNLCFLVEIDLYLFTVC